MATHQETLNKVITDWTEAVRDYTLGVTDRARLPDPKEAVANAFDFAEQVLRAQRELATGLLEATGKAAEATAKAAQDAAERLAPSTVGR